MNEEEVAESSLEEVINLDTTGSTIELSADDFVAEISPEDDDDFEIVECTPVQLNSDPFISEMAQNEEVRLFFIFRISYSITRDVGPGL